MVKLNEGLVLARSRAADLESVIKLNCWGSELTDISILKETPNVEVVSLSVNHISSLADLASCKNLQELYIRRNDIKNLAEICYLKNLPKLRILWLADNPCAVGDRYRMTVLKTLPNLQKFDNVLVQQEEINDAIEQGQELTPPKGCSSSSSAPSRPKTPKKTEKSFIKLEDDTSTLSLEETNKIRENLGLKALPAEKVTPQKTRHTGGAKARNANILQAVLSLVKELDADSLETIGNAVKNRLESF
ncbi:unnamed protein product [Owenia fusiformis]|uniref:Uncharacterized protein n=1 Tax=Owenia fusiformis TaxID=6347 RepID=A0A8J1Y0D4_OWEFU|nr:unnamed protein product [Owenia fusiformis]